jgi:hypothetical protein
MAANPLLTTTARLDQMTGTELDHAVAAVTCLLGEQVRPCITDMGLVAKLSSLGDDLTNEQTERRAIVASMKPVGRNTDGLA